MSINEFLWNNRPVELKCFNCKQFIQYGQGNISKTCNCGQHYCSKQKCLSALIVHKCIVRQCYGCQNKIKHLNLVKCPKCMRYYCKNQECTNQLEQHLKIQHCNYCTQSLPYPINQAEIYRRVCGNHQCVEKYNKKFPQLESCCLIF